MKTNKWLTMAAVLTISASLAVAAPHGGKGRHFGHGRAHARIAAKLNLTDAQKAQIREYRQASREANKAFFEGARQTRQEYRAAKKAGDAAAVARLEPVLKEQRAQMREMRKGARQQFLSVLTPEQKAQLEQWKTERESRRGKN